MITIVGTRPEVIRLSRLIPKLDEHTNHVLVHTGQNFDPSLKDVFFNELGLRPPDYYLDIDTSSLGAMMGDTLRKSESILLQEMPDAVLILGDTNSAIVAILAERLRIPVYHMEAGNRSFDNNVPEELNRKIVDHTVSFNLPYNDYSLRNLINEGLHPRFIHKTGSPLPEIYAHYKDKIFASTVLEKLGLEEKRFFLVSIHRQENVDEPERLDAILTGLIALRDHWNLPIVFSTHPRTRLRLETLKRGAGLDGIQFHDPFGYIDYCKLQLGAMCVVSDSGTISEESSIMGFDAVTIRDSMERPEAMEKGVIMMTGLDSNNLLRCVKLASTPVKKATPEGYADTSFSHVVLSYIFSTVTQHKEWKGLRVSLQDSKTTTNFFS